MTALTHDASATPTALPSRFGAGLGFAAISAASFGISGSLAKGLLDAGWSSGAAVTVRVSLAALVLLVPAVIILRGRWALLRRNAGLVAGYGLVAVAGCQLAYFNAVAHMQVGVALLIEYTAPVAVVSWVWWRYGHRPGRLTLAGAAVALAGLVLVLDLLSGADLSVVGVVWALLAMVGAATYFVISASESNGLPPIVLAASGLVLGAAALLVAGAVGLVPMHASTQDVTYRGGTVAWWLPLVALGLVSAALAYVTGIAASRRLGPRLASFVALLEVVAALSFAWLLLGELPQAIQFVGGALILGGVVLVKLGENYRAS
ncbi:DMT family transporter [Nocardioides sp.]|uniref:EamA family transporter n=1 Tax=Nocardioides sp. TaxID=35761 RepID=UPI0035666F9D